ncbi:MAG: hypothetical protein LBB35_03420 [Coriobacteriaceae bacterium]|nr:hypothetical protein [Coriobacteriaceae bacterium]
MPTPRINLKKPENEPRGNSPVIHMSGESLNRPLTMPWVFRPIFVFFIVAAILIGYFIFQRAYDAIIVAPQQEIENFEKNLSRDVPLQLPVLTSLVQLDNETIYNVFAESGYTTIDRNTLNNVESTGIDVVRIPEGVSEADAKLAFANKLNGISGSEVILMLNGSWQFTVGRDGYIDMKVKYADLKSHTIEEAIETAVQSQGLSDAYVEEVGEDNAGNTFKSGIVTINETNYYWRVSACALSELYPIDGIPKEACYVGIRLYL